MQVGSRGPVLLNGYDVTEFVVYESDKFFVVLLPPHRRLAKLNSVMFAKRQAPSFEESLPSEDDWCEFWKTAHEVADRICKNTGTPDYAIHSEDIQDAELPRKCMYAVIFPRFEGDPVIDHVYDHLWVQPVVTEAVDRKAFKANPQLRLSLEIESEDERLQCRKEVQLLRTWLADV